MQSISPKLSFFISQGQQECLVINELHEIYNSCLKGSFLEEEAKNLLEEFKNKIEGQITRGEISDSPIMNKILEIAQKKIGRDAFYSDRTLESLKLNFILDQLSNIIKYEVENCFTFSNQNKDYFLAYLSVICDFEIKSLDDFLETYKDISSKLRKEMEKLADRPEEAAKLKEIEEGVKVLYHHLEFLKLSKNQKMDRLENFLNKFLEGKVNHLELEVISKGFEEEFFKESNTLTQENICSLAYRVFCLLIQDYDSNLDYKKLISSLARAYREDFNEVKETLEVFSQESKSEFLGALRDSSFCSHPLEEHLLDVLKISLLETSFEFPEEITLLNTIFCLGMNSAEDLFEKKSFFKVLSILLKECLFSLKSAEKKIMLVHSITEMLLTRFIDSPSESRVSKECLEEVLAYCNRWMSAPVERSAHEFIETFPLLVLYSPENLSFLKPLRIFSPPENQTHSLKKGNSNVEEKKKAPTSIQFQDPFIEFLLSCPHQPLLKTECGLCIYPADLRLIAGRISWDDEYSKYVSQFSDIKDKIRLKTLTEEDEAFIESLYKDIVLA